MLHDKDAKRIDSLSRRLRAPTKIAVVRAALDLLEEQANREERVKRWRQAAKVARKESAAVWREIHGAGRHSRTD